MNYQETTDYLLNIPKFTGKHTVEDTRAFYKLILPDTSKMKIIHVAGTNGKGSVCAYLRSVLRAMGYTVGIFTSPHLVKINERIKYEDCEITDDEMVTYFEKVKAYLIPGEYHPSFFEYFFFMAMLYFADKKPDYIILETGLGGKLDATNVIDDPVVNIITRIGYDHMAYLGNTLESIAGEKAGILRAGVPVVYDALVEEAAGVIEARAKELDCPSYPLTKADFSLKGVHNKNIDFCYVSRYYSSVRLTLGTGALYQIENASLALKAAEVLFDKSELTEDIIRKAVKETYWKARMDEVLPGVFVDGAHNEDGIRAFIESVSANSGEGKRRLIFGVVKDKEYDKMVEDIVRSRLFESIDVVTIDNPRTVVAAELAELFKKAGYEGIGVYDSVKEAYKDAESRKEDGDVIYIAGSLYLAGEIFDYLGL
ncbi:dihydrofolate synthase / folylpolyglutamate synthase [Lachnospiraceae bacterium G11]|nr:dihydrofolate synthase / folylpolyglutamate synthase [Lachnospiraceae bacterium G11]